MSSTPPKRPGMGAAEALARVLGRKFPGFRFRAVERSSREDAIPLSTIRRKAETAEESSSSSEPSSPDAI